MNFRSRVSARAFCSLLLFGLTSSLHAFPTGSWSGVVRDAAGNAVGIATVKLVLADRSGEYAASTSSSGQFVFIAVAAGSYKISVSAAGKIWTAADPVVIKEGATLTESKGRSFGAW